MSVSPNDVRPEPNPRIALRIALIYATFGVLWILSSDWIVARIAPDAVQITQWQTIKGWSYVAVTALLVYALVQRGVLATQRSHQLLARSEERYRAIVETSLDGIALTDTTGNLVFANARLAEMAGCRPEELLGQPLASLLHDGQGESLACLPSGKSVDVAQRHDVRILRPDGQERWAIASICPLLDEGGVCVGTLAMLTDITERKRLTDELHQSQKMEAVGQLAGGVAHDLNNLLMAIFGYTDLARDTLTADHPARTALEGVMAAAEQAAGVSRALLTFSRKTPVQKQPVDLNDAVRKAVKLLQRLLPSSIHMVTDLAADGPVFAYADPTQVQQIIMNLAINARDAMPDGGTLTMATRPGSRAGADVEEHAARLLVTDTGMGITPDVKRHLFEPFFTTKPKGVGTGLGLSIIHGIVQDHGGTIEVESKPGKGANFTVTLPAPTAAGPVAAAPTTERIRGAGELILIAEDNPQVRELTVSVLSARGYEILPFEDGQDLLDAFIRHQDRVRLIVTDEQMPRRNGLDCLKEIRSKGSRVPAIIITASLDSDVDDQIDPHTTLLRKPHPMADLVTLVAQRLAETRHMT